MSENDVSKESSLSRPLLGLKVLDFSRGMAGALATMLLADYGADVTKVVLPRGRSPGPCPGISGLEPGQEIFGP